MKYAWTSPPQSWRQARKLTGFSLIEVMVVVVVIGILAAVALPSYQESVRRGNRAAARAALLEAQQFMERFYAANNAYDQTLGSVAVALPARFASVPPESPKYSLALSTTSPATATTYRLEATPLQTDSKCAVLFVTNTGVKGTTGTGSVADCWK